VLRNMLQLDSGAGRVPPMLRNVQSGADIINLKNDGTSELVTKPFTVRKFEDGCFDVQITTNSVEEAAHYVPHIAAQIGCTEEQLLEFLKSATGSLTERRPDPVHHALGFGGPLAVRSVAKERVWCRISQLPIRKICSEFITPMSDQKKDGCNVSSRTLLCFGRTPSVFSPHLSGNFGGGAGLLLGL
jgi:hypothetical protein